MTVAPTRILRIITRLNIGGPAVQAALLSTRLDPQRFSTCLVVGEPEATEGDLSVLVQDVARLVRLKTLGRPIRPWADARSLWHILKLVWHERPQIIHTHMAKAGALGRLAGILYNRLGPGRTPSSSAVLIHTFHGHVLDGYFPPWLSWVFLTIERWLAHQTHCLIAVSETIRRQLLERGIGRPDQWRIIPLGLDLSALGALPLPNGSAPVRFGMVGRLAPIKNPALFLEALHRVVGQGREPRLQGMVVGDGPLRPDLEEHSRQLGLRHMVRFTGWQQDLCAVYGSLDVVCLTSLSEGTPLALIEAMAAGRAVVATDVGGVRDVLDPDASLNEPIPSGGFRQTAVGVLVRSGDVEGFAVALCTMAADATLRARLGQAARASVMQRFGAERLLRDVAQLYGSLQR